MNELGKGLAKSTSLRAVTVPVILEELQWRGIDQLSQPQLVKKQLVAFVQ